MITHKLITFENKGHDYDSVMYTQVLSEIYPFLLPLTKNATFIRNDYGIKRRQSQSSGTVLYGSCIDLTGRSINAQKRGSQIFVDIHKKQIGRASLSIEIK